VVISGNHETPKLRETGNVFRIFEHLDHIYPIYKGEYETLDFTGVKLHCIPQTPHGEQLQEALGQLTIDAGMRNILLLHVGILGMKEFRMGDFNEHIIPKTVLPSDMDYIALGHYHGATQITENAFYAGSTERLSFKEEKDTKGFWEITFDESRDMQFIPLDARDMVTLELDCSTVSPQDTMDHITTLLKQCDPSGKILRFFLYGVPRQVYNTLDFDVLEDITKETTHFELLPEFPEDEHIVQAGGVIGNLLEEWMTFFSQVSLDKDKEEIGKLAVHYLSRVEQ
jgi:DNA repair exonuclease SbcCD nuclease subunit